MQSCVVCGWDTRSGSRVCAACRTAVPADASTPVGAPLSEAEAQLAAALRSAHGHAPADADVSHVDHVDGERGAPDGANAGELAASDAMTTGEFPAVHGRVAPPEHRPTDAAEHLSELFNTPSPWDEPGQRDTADDLAALFDQPHLWRGASAPDAPPTSAPITDDEQHLAPRPHDTQQPAAPDDATAFEALTDALVDAPHDAQPRDVQEPRDTSAHPVEQWPWVSKYGDGGFWAPPAVHDTGRARTAHADTPAPGHNGAASDPHATTDAAPASPPGDDPRLEALRDAVSDAPAGPTADAFPDDGRDAANGAAAPATAARPAETRGGRVRTLFTYLGGWTAVAQIALLAVGMLCVIQIFVLVVVLSYLNDGADPGGDAIGSMAAYGKVDSVMLPALFAFAVGALVLAAWRGWAERSGGGARHQVLGLPIGLWGALVGVIALLGVIVAAQSTTSVADAQRITQMALVACGVLGVSCFAAPRGLG